MEPKSVLPGTKKGSSKGSLWGQPNNTFPLRVYIKPLRHGRVCSPRFVDLGL